ncbi:MAG TPA: NMD3-related protein [Methanomassiliicoccales archaeon]|nr:NMD3-related protein [Methanomassiliicoccales archaeon]
MFCVECGKEGATYESLCAQCFLSRNRFTEIDEYIDLTRCAHCLEFLIDGRWKRFQSIEDAAAEVAVRSINVRRGSEIKSVEVAVDPLDSSNFRVSIEMTLQMEDLIKTEHLVTTVRVKGASCPKCSKIKGSYFESILQVRCRDRSLRREEKESILEQIEDMVERAASENRELFISKVEELHGGLDVYLSSNNLGRSLSKELAAAYGAETKESSSLIGQKDGREMYRITFLVRLPAYQLHDIISLDGVLHQVEGISSTNTRLRKLSDHQHVTMQNHDLENVRVKGTESDIMEAVIVSESEDEIQVMHPITYGIVELRKPKDFQVEGDAVKVFSHDGELFLVPY